MLLMTLLAPWAAKAQEQTVITCYPPTQEYATGYTDGTTKTSGVMQTQSDGGEQGWMKFDVSSIPDNATIDAITLYFYVTNANGPWVRLTSAGELDPVTASASDLYSAITNDSPNYYTSDHMSSFSANSWKSITMSSSAITNLQTNGLTNNYFTLGFHEYETGDYHLYAAGYDDANKPYLQVTCTVPVTCSKPTLSTDVPTTTTTATLSWTPSGAEQTLFDIYWSEDNTDPTELTTPGAANQTGTSYTIPGLTPGKTYYAWIRGNCGTASSPDYTFWTNGVSFDTQCQAIAALGYDEKFDTYTASSSFLPNCWTPINGGASYNTYPSIYNSGAYSTSNCLRFYVYGSSTTTTIADQYAVLPEMTGMAGLQITFMAKGYNTGNTFKIGQMSDPTDVSTFNEIATKSLTTTYEECNFLLTGKGNYIAILMEKPTSSSSTTIGVYIDNISIHTPPTCIKPTDLAVTASGLNATVTWESEESQWQVAYATSATADPDDNIVATVDAKTYTTDPLTIDNDYYFWVRSYCSASDQSDWVGPVSVHIGYCLPSINNVDGNGFTNITYGTGENIVNNDVPKTTYADYTNLVGAVQAGVEATVTITNSTGYDYGTIIWVDLDNSLSFEDSEIVFAYNIPNQTTPYAATFIIPATQTVGDYVMRIGAADSSFDSYVKGQTTTPPSACFSTNWGTCQDYTLRVLEKPSCLTPTALNVTTDGATAIATWSGEATSYNIDINGTVTNNINIPYEFPVALSTDYAVKVQANCSGSETSDWSNVFNFTTPPCVGGHLIEYTLNDQYNDSWNGASISIMEGCTLLTTLTLADGQGPLNGSLTLCGDYYQFIWNSGDYDNECSFTFTEGGTILFTKPSPLSDGQVLYTIGTPSSCAVPSDLTHGTPDVDEVELSWTENGTATSWQICVNGDETNLVTANTNPYTLGGLTPDTDYTVKVRAYCDKDDQSCWSDEDTFTTDEACAKPTNLTTTNITTESATFSWEGTSGNYVLQYRPWFQVGEDHLSTDEFVTYTYDLSEYKGQGSIAIRHYDVTDVFYLNVDDVKLKDSDDAVIFFEDFESGEIPASWTNYDVDGDGYTWDLASAPTMNVNGNYGVYSASWLSGVGALTPDNWLIINNVPMGGTFSFAARGQDPNFPAENFAVYISLESDVTEIPVAGTTYNATNLTPGTPYAWQVKSDCGMYQSNWVTKLFKTVDNLLVFANNGDWDDIDNWEDVDGNPAAALPTIDNKVRVDADAIIPAGVVGTAGKTTISTGGSITIEDGGQLKHNSATLWVTMEKEITGVGTTNWNDDEYSKGWYLISTPFSGTTEIEQDGAWSHVQNITTTTSAYDLYAFNSTEALEWINYKVDPTNSEFTAGNNNGLVFKKSYLYANEADVTMEFTGTISKSINNSMTDDHNYDPSSSNTFNGFKLVGNPFSCNGYLTFTPSGSAPTEVDFYVMNAEGDDFDLSETHVALPPLTGAFFYADATGTINFSSEVPTSKRGNGALNINLAQNGKTADMARIRFGEGMRLAKYQLNESSKIYFTQEDKDYAVVHTQAEGEMPLNFKAETTGQYTISFKLDGANVGYLHLIDKATGEDINLLTSPEYSFVGSPRDAEDRFIIRFGEMAANDFFVYQSGDELIVNGEGTLQVYDVMGRFVASYNVNGTESINASQFENAVYIFRLVGTDVKTQKIVVR